MAKKSKKNEKFNYNASVNALKAEGPAGLYLIWGPEDYLADRFFEEIKKLCITSEADDFSYRRLDERDFSLLSLKEAIDSVPFLSERSLVEVRGVDINKLRESDEISAVLSDIPDYCTVVFVAPIGFEPDKRLKVYKAIQKYGKEICATAQGGDILIKWIIRRFAAEGKGIELNAVQRLINVSGELMNGLIPEINKIASYTKGDRVTEADVDAVAHHIPEAVVFDMTEALAKGENNAAMRLLGELLADKNNEPTMILAIVGGQMRKMYAARVAIDNGLDKDYVMKALSLRYDFMANRLLAASRRFSTAQIIRAVELCAETDYAMKSSRTEPTELLKECVMRIAAGEEHA